MKNSNISGAAKTFGASKLVKGFRLSWLVYGAAAYYGLKYLNKKGFMPKQTEAALGLVDKGIDYAKSQIGLGESTSQPFTAANSKSKSASNEVRH